MSDDGVPAETFTPDLTALEGLGNDAARALMEAGQLSVEIRRLRRRVGEAARQRRALLLAATDPHRPREGRRATYPLAHRMVGLEVSVVTREVGIARQEAAGQAGHLP